MYSILDLLIGRLPIDGGLEINDDEVSYRLSLDTGLDAAECCPLLVVRAPPKLMDQLCILHDLDVFNGVFIRRLLVFLLRTAVVTDDRNISVVSPGLSRDRRLLFKRHVEGGHRLGPCHRCGSKVVVRGSRNV